MNKQEKMQRDANYDFWVLRSELFLILENSQEMVATVADHQHLWTLLQIAKFLVWNGYRIDYHARALQARTFEPDEKRSVVDLAERMRIAVLTRMRGREISLGSGQFLTINQRLANIELLIKKSSEKGK